MSGELKSSDHHSYRTPEQKNPLYSRNSQHFQQNYCHLSLTPDTTFWRIIFDVEEFYMCSELQIENQRDTSGQSLQIPHLQLP